MKNVIVDPKYNNKKLNTFLLETFPYLSFHTLQKALRKKDIKVNGKRVSENIVVHQNDEVTIYIVDELLEPVKPVFDIVYEDDHICVINKPAGIEITGDNSLASITHYLPCHRLDRNTTGLVLFAKEEDSLSILLQAFKDHTIEKHYLCKVFGIPNEKQATLEAFLFKDQKKSQVYIYDTFQKGSQPIKTSYQVLTSNKQENTSILDVTLHTGKTHQIRAHLAHIGHPIIGDGKYGINQVNKKLKQKTQLLCAYKLILPHSLQNTVLNHLAGKTFEIKPDWL